MTFSVAINKSIINKAVNNDNWSKFSKFSLTLEELAQAINKGFAFAPHFRVKKLDAGKSSKIFERAGYIALDYDHHDPSIIINNPEINKYIGIYYFTPSSTDDEPRFRLVFQLEEDITDAIIYEQLETCLVNKFNADIQCVDSCRMFYGSFNSNPQVYPDSYLPSFVWRQWLNEFLLSNTNTFSTSNKFNHLLASPIQVLINSDPFILSIINGDLILNYNLWLALATNLIEVTKSPSCYGASGYEEALATFIEISKIDAANANVDFNEENTIKEFDKAVNRINEGHTKGYTYEFINNNGGNIIVPSTISRPAEIVSKTLTKAPKKANPFVWACLHLVVDRKGIEHPIDIISNVLKILDNDPRQKDRYSYDQMKLAPCLDGIPLADKDDARITEWLQDIYQLRSGIELVRQAITAISHQRQFHPVKEYLESLIWDNQPRINLVVNKVLGISTNDASYNIYLKIIKKWFVSCVARAIDPGCKVDTVMILTGKQGIYKSSFFNVLAGNDWFSDTKTGMGSKDALMTLARSWIAEWSELDVYKRAEREETKAFLTSRVDKYRPPYAHRDIEVPRSYVIVGTTNDTQFLTDISNRRFWPIPIIDKINIQLLKEWRDQLWAEAVTIYRDGYKWWFEENEENQLEINANQFRIDDPWEMNINDWIAGKTKFTSTEVLIYCLQLTSAKDQTRSAQMRVSEHLIKVGWESPKVSRRGKEVGRFWNNPFNLDAIPFDSNNSEDSNGEYEPLILRDLPNV